MTTLINASADYVYGFSGTSDFGVANTSCFAACQTGLKRSDDNGLTWYSARSTIKQQLNIAITSVVIAPDYHNEHLILAGAAGGLLRSQDDGESWTSIVLPTPPPTISALAISPDFTQDGMIFAATLEDGVLCSIDRGNTWVAWNFGLLDLNVHHLAISPSFNKDELLIVGTESGIYRSTNGGRAWKEIELPCGFRTVLTLSFSPTYSVDQIVYAGTENDGLYQSNDCGINWHRLGQDSLNGTVSGVCPNADGLLLIHEGRVFLSTDIGSTFQPWQPMANNSLETTAIFAPNSLSAVLAGFTGGVLLRI